MKTASNASPCCGVALDAATCLEDLNAAPVDGDLSVCMYCYAWLVFEGGTPRVMTKSEIDELPNDVVVQLLDVVQAAKLANELKRQRGGA